MHTATYIVTVKIRAHYIINAYKNKVQIKLCCCNGSLVIYPITEDTLHDYFIHGQSIMLNGNLMCTTKGCG